MRDVLIIGYGVVGKNLEKELAALQPDIYDKYQIQYNRLSRNRYDLAFVCVPASEIRTAIKENSADLYILKSAILPGTTDLLREETGERIIYSPEYRGATVHNDCQFDFTILG